MKNGSEIAVEQINPFGNVLGKKLARDVENDARDPSRRASVAERVAGAKIPFVDQHLCSLSSIPQSEAYSEGTVPRRLRATR